MFARRTEWPLNPNALARETVRRREAGRPIIDLTESNPTRCGFNYDSAAILGALARPEALVYSPTPRGPLAARQAVAAYYGERGIAVDPECIFLTASTSEAYSYLFRLLADPGDTVLAPQPSYPLFDFLAGLNDAGIIPYPLTYDSVWRIDVAELGARLAGADRTFHAPRAIIVVHPNNPTGSFVHADEREALVELCARYDLAMIADEVFTDFALPEAARVAPAPSHAGLDAALTFTLSGLSKIAALPQLKLAWIVVSGPRALRKRALDRLEIIADTYLSINTPVAAGAAELLATRHEIQAQILARVRENIAELDLQLERSPVAERLRVEGGWYAVLRLQSGASQSHETNEEALVVRLVREQGVLVHPGHFYDFPSDGHLVLSTIPPADAFAEGVARLLALIERSPPR